MYILFWVGWGWMGGSCLSALMKEPCIYYVERRRKNNRCNITRAKVSNEIIVWDVAKGIKCVAAIFVCVCACGVIKRSWKDFAERFNERVSVCLSGPVTSNNFAPFATVCRSPINKIILADCREREREKEEENLPSFNRETDKDTR
jgi:hypothetical protein